MEQHIKRRGILVTAGALITAAALSLGGAAVAHANSQPVPAESPVTITKLAQPETLEGPATGEQITDLSGYEPIGGVVFDYYLVTDTGIGSQYDIGTNAGQEFAVDLTAATAPVGSTATGSFPATHSTQGASNLTLPRGLYLVQEDPSTVPAGVTATAPFLLPVPLTDPTSLDGWLDHIYVYPKNSQITAEKTVHNSDIDVTDPDGNQLTVGEDVTWAITTDIPRVENPAFDGGAAVSDTNLQFVAPDLFRIDDTLRADQLEYVGATVSLNGGVTFLVDDATDPGNGDYTITPVHVLQDPALPEDPDNNPVVATTYQILFTEQGREALATAVNAEPNAQVTVSLTTTVLAAEQIENAAKVWPNSDSVTGNKPIEVPETDVRYGNADFTKLSSNDDFTDLAGAQFRVYTSLADATNDTANGGDRDTYLVPVFPVAPTGYDNAGTWTTAADGSFSVTGLRYSGYADGEPFDNTDPRYVTYYLVEVTALEDHQLLAEPLEFHVTGEPTTDGFEIENQYNEGSFELPLTGGMGTAFLTIGGIAILAVVLLVARSRRNNEVAAE